MGFSFAMRLDSSSKYSSNKNILKYEYLSSLALVFNEFFLCDEANLIIQVLFKIFSSIHRIQVLFIAEITYFYILSSSNDI